ncbi:MAG: hypothetical protein AAB300_03100 [Nitrospirota bacterium]
MGKLTQYLRSALMVVLMLVAAFCIYQMVMVISPATDIFAPK